MSTSRDVEKGESDEENWALLGDRNEERQNGGVHLNQADVKELADFKKPSSMKIGSNNANSVGEKLETEHNQNSNMIDVEKGEHVEENQALLGARNEGREYDGEHLTQADLMKLVEMKKPGPSSRRIIGIYVEAEKQNKFQEPDLSEGTNKSEKTNDPEESTDELQKPEPDQNFSLIEAIYNYGNKELISWIEDFKFLKTCPIHILRAACKVQYDEQALQILLDAGAEIRRVGRTNITPLHVAAFAGNIMGKPNNKALFTAALGFPKGSTNDADVLAAYRNISFIFDICHTDMKNPFREGEEHQITSRPHYLPPGYTALHLASACAHSQAVRVLLALGANPNVRDKSNSTPLDVAGRFYSDKAQSYEETLELLRLYGGSLSRSEDLVLERALRMRSLQALRLLLDAGAPINQRNPEGYTPMHLCVELRLKEHLEVLAHHSSPEMNYRAVDVTDNTGSTALHWAAREGWLEGVTVALLARADTTHENSVGDTAFLLAVKDNHFEIVKQILDYDRNKQIVYYKTHCDNKSSFSINIYELNPDFAGLKNDDMRYYSYATKIGDLTPLEYAAANKYQKLFICILKNSGIEISKYETTRILNLLAKHNLPELFSELNNTGIGLRYSFKRMIAKNCVLHEAITHRSREMIIAIIREGADLSQRNKDGQTAISLLMYHMTKPTELMTEILDGCINTDKNINDKDCVITINYSVLNPEIYTFEKSMSDVEADHDDDNDNLKTKTNDMKVLEALKDTGDVYDQRSLLTHPVVESFLYLKWQKCAKFINFLISAYVLFLISLNTFMVTIYYHMDHKIEEQDILWIFKPTLWRVFAICASLIFCLVVVLFWLSSPTKLHCDKTIWLKLLSSKTKRRRNKTNWLKLLLIVGGAIMICTPMDAADTDIIRGVAVITVSLSWIYLMILLSWTPTLGYYMQMYGKVSRNVIKVILSFSFPLVGFSICFMILLRSKEPFDDPIAAFLKTMVMMSSEFEYENLMKNKTTDSAKDATNSTLDSLEDTPLTSVFMLRLFFLLFLLCVAIVLMNLMTSVAVNDIQELADDGRQRHLMKQIECITALEKLIFHFFFKFQRWPLRLQIVLNFFLYLLLQFTGPETWKVPSKVHFTSDSKIFGTKTKKNILNKAQSLKETEEKKTDDVVLRGKIDEIYDLTKKQSDLEKELSEIRKSVNTILKNVERIAESENNILEAIANMKRANLSLGRTK